jgi:hypothetical protein
MIDRLWNVPAKFMLFSNNSFRTSNARTQQLKAVLACTVIESAM